jgi:hypothetical protein
MPSARIPKPKINVPNSIGRFENMDGIYSMSIGLSNVYFRKSTKEKSIIFAFIGLENLDIISPLEDRGCEKAESAKQNKTLVSPINP